MHHRMHNKDSGHPPGHFGRPLDHEEFLASLDIPVYMQEVDPLIPTSVRYPLASVSGFFGGYYTSTAAYMLALALYEQVDQIGMLGIYMDKEPEYSAQRPCVEYYLGVMKGMGGTKLVLPEDCTLAEAPLYAYDEFADPKGTLKLEEVRVLEAVSG
jgi:hypothetical protein